MTDPFVEFVARAGRSECAGYFERAGGHSDPAGIAAWFDRGEAVEVGTDDASFRETADRVDRHLRSSRSRLAMGYLSFEAYGLFEPALRSFARPARFPLGEFLLPAVVHVGPGRATLSLRSRGRRRTSRRPRSDSLSAAAFVRGVGHLRREIRAGEAFQVVLAHRREWARPDDLLAAAQRLRGSERFAYFYYLRSRGREIVGASPESVVEVDRDMARVNPIAGTRPRRGGSHRLPLRADPKELCEHRMLVDLARNDLGRIARPGSVRLPWHERRTQYARVEHLVSRVEGRLRPGTGPWDALAATFPAGTVSGAPKIRATQLLRREEGTWRGPYGGAVGLLRSGGRADWALTIRSAFAEGRSVYTAAGAGIVHASRPSQEYRETLEKLSTLESALLEPE